MKHLFNLFGVALVAGLLSSAGLANAGGVGTLHDYMGNVGAGALTNDGAVFGWGRSGYAPSTTPMEFYVGTPVTRVSRNGEFAVLNNGAVFDFMQGGAITGLNSAQAVFVSPNYQGPWGTSYPSWAAQNNGTLQSFVVANGTPYVQSTGLSNVWADVVPRKNLLGVGANTSPAWVIGASGQLFDVQSTWTGSGISNTVVTISGMTNVTVVEELNGNTFVTRTDGTVWAWGAGITPGTGALDTHSKSQQTVGVSSVSAVQVSGIVNVVSLKTADPQNDGSNVYALTAAGDVWAWGSNSYGQLGNGDWWDAPLPTQVSGLTNIVSIHAAGGSVLALAADGTVWAWGDNYYGQLGLGSNIDVETPVQIPGLSGITSLDIAPERLDAATGAMIAGAYTIAAKSDGSVWTWGDNSVGQLGNGTRVASNVPVQVLGMHGYGYLTLDPAVLDFMKNGAPFDGGSMVFTGQAVSTTSAAQTITIINTGMTSWTGFTLGSATGDFAQNNNCGVELLPGASCTMNVTFTPTRAGLRSGVLPFSQPGNNNYVGGVLTLSGTGLGPQAVLSPSLGFGTQKTTTTTTKVVTLSNAGNTTLTVGTAGITGAGFSLGTNTCGATLAAGASCTMNVSFAPTVVQAYTATLSFTGSNNPGGAASMALSGAGAAAASVRGDFNGDGKADILWRNTAGQNALWLMNGTSVSSTAYTPAAAIDWSAVGISDFSGDGKADILWRNQTTGANALWSMNAQNILTASLISSAHPGWMIARTGDFDGDAKAGDILWLNASTGQVAVWLTNASGQVTSAGLLGTVSQGWSIAGVGDFDGNGKSDILWRNTTTGVNAMWFMNGAAIASTAAVQTVPATWAVKGIGDFDGNGKADILWRDAGAGIYAAWFMNGAALLNGAYLSSSPPVAWSPAQFADFNGDGKTDIAWRDTTGLTAIWLMNGATISVSALLGTIPVSFTMIGK